MLTTIATSLAGGVAGLSAYLYMKLRRPAGFPPGPPVYPILGSLPCFDVSGSDDEGVQFQMELMKHAKHYGPVMSFAVGHSWIVVVSDYESYKEAFVTIGDDIAGRPDQGRVSASWNPNNKELSVADGTFDEQWKLQHFTVLQVMRTLGYGRNVSEARITEEADILIETFKNMSEPIDIVDHVGSGLSNIVMTLVYGQRFDYYDEDFRNFRKNISIGFEGIQFAAGFAKVPGIDLWPTFRREEKKLYEAFAVVNDFLARKLAEHPPDDSIDEPTNFIEGYRLEMKRNPELQDRLFQCINDFVQAGMGTTTQTLGWGIYHMVANPEKQAKVQEEMDRVVGRSRRPNLLDRASLHYTQAALNEVLRLATTIPTTLPHETIKECKVGGYTIPKGTEVWGNLWGVLRDPDMWPEPNEFRPERFLDDKGHFKPIDEFIPFGMGKRTCLGVQLAKQEVFIIFSNLLHSFVFSSPDGSIQPTTKGIIQLFHKAPKYKAQATYRDAS